MNTKHAIVAMAVLLAPLACGTEPEVSSIGPQSPRPLPAGSVAGPYVQAGTQFSVQLDERIQTSDSRRAPGFRPR